MKGPPTNPFCVRLPALQVQAQLAPEIYYACRSVTQCHVDIDLTRNLSYMHKIKCSNSNMLYAESLNTQTGGLFMWA
jgi:hypothetical protein